MADETEITPSEETTEESVETAETPETPETSETEIKPQEPTPAPDETPDEEHIKLFKEVKAEVGAKRFDGLMSAWQADRRGRIEAEDKVDSLSKQPVKETLTPTPTPKANASDEAWLEYLDKQLSDRRSQREAEEDTKIATELKAVQRDFPTFTNQELIDTAIKYGGDKPISLAAAAQILTDIKAGSKVGAENANAEIVRKKLAGGLGGKTGVETKSGLKAFDPTKDSGKPYEQLIQEAKEEIGI